MMMSFVSAVAGIDDISIRNKFALAIKIYFVVILKSLRSDLGDEQR